jgi:fructose-bisphosphate aldolase class II
LDKAKEAIDAGVDSIVVDGAKLPLEENIALVKQVVAYARASGRDVVVEGELGYIGQSSKQLDELPEGVSEANLTTPEDAQKFVRETGVDCFAPAVGNIHGMLKAAAEPRLHPDRVQAVAAATGVPLVLHGASGNTEDDIKACIAAGIAVVHINTELRVLYHDSLKESLKGDETTPYKFLNPAVQKMKEYVVGKISVFAGK